MTVHIATVAGRFARGAPVFSHADARTSGTPEEKARVLVVEDDFFVAHEIEHQLNQAGYDVVGTAATAADALRLARSKKPAIVIMDVRLRGDGDGVEAAISIYKELGIRSIFATAHHDQRTRARGEEAKPITWIQKPFAPDELLQAVKAGTSL
jgi:DNA-binding response OmpR family regulator